MADTTRDAVLIETIWQDEGAMRRVRQAALVVFGVLLLAAAAKIRIPMWPVPTTMQTFAVLTLGAAYGARLGLGTVLAYLAVGAVGFDVFTSSSATNGGLAYMFGPTGGYLAGFAIAAFVMGRLAERGWDRSVAKMTGAMLIGNAIIYAVGLPWMAHLFLAEKGAAWVIQWGLTSFLAADVLKLALAVMMFQGVWKLTGKARG